VRRLPELIEFLLVNSNLLQDPIEQWRADLPSAVNRNCCGAPVRMPPSFVAPRLACLEKTELSRGAAEFVNSVR
jgi:hypothetical protein